jgi:hypothetical protein
VLFSKVCPLQILKVCATFFSYKMPAKQYN